MLCPYRKRTTSWRNKDITDQLEEFTGCSGDACPFYCKKGKKEACGRVLREMGTILIKAEDINEQTEQGRGGTLRRS